MNIYELWTSMNYRIILAFLWHFEGWWNNLCSFFPWNKERTPGDIHIRSLLRTFWLPVRLHADVGFWQPLSFASVGDAAAQCCSTSLQHILPCAGNGIWTLGCYHCQLFARQTMKLSEMQKYPPESKGHTMRMHLYPNVASSHKYSARIF